MGTSANANCHLIGAERKGVRVLGIRVGGSTAGRAKI